MWRHGNHEHEDDMWWHDAMTWHVMTQDFMLTWHACHDMAWHKISCWHDMSWHGMTWHDMAWHGMTWHDMAWHGMTWHDTRFHADMTRWHDMSWHFMIQWDDISSWCGTARNNIFKCKHATMGCNRNTTWLEHCQFFTLELARSVIKIRWRMCMLLVTAIAPWWRPRWPQGFQPEARVLQWQT